jgi:uncharacterized membrane protein YfcA
MHIFIAIVIGVAAGIAGGLFGIGGGVLIVPALVVALKFSQQKSQGTSLVALLAPVGILALLEYRQRGEVDLTVGIFIACGFLVGAYLGAKMALGLPEETMRRIFAVFLMIVAIWMFTKKGG